MKNSTRHLRMCVSVCERYCVSERASERVSVLCACCPLTSRMQDARTRTRTHSTPRAHTHTLTQTRHITPSNTMADALRMHLRQTR